MTDENYEASAQAHLASLKRDMRVNLEDAVVRAVHKVWSEFEAKSDERLMEDWGPGPHEVHSLPARGADQPAQPHKGIADHINQTTNGRVQIDSVIGDVGIGTPSQQPAQQEPVAWPIETNNQVEALAKHCGWDNRRYMTPADYQIWCDRMRQFAQLADPQPPAQRKPLTDANKQFNAAIDFAVEQGSQAALFLRHWREGDTEEWPEFDDYLAAHGITKGGSA